MKCNSPFERCRCVLQEHDNEIPHVCECGGSWKKPKKGVQYQIKAYAGGLDPHTFRRLVDHKINIDKYPPRGPKKDARSSHRRNPQPCDDCN
jgi:hypothetical protein